MSFNTSRKGSGDGTIEENSWEKPEAGTVLPVNELRNQLTICSSDVLPERTIGVWGGIFLIVNKIMGAGIFSTPGNIYRNCGSVGMSLFIWVIAGVIATCGAFVLLELGTVCIGLKNYLERAFHPRLASTCIYAFYCIFLQVSASNAITFSSYILLAAGVESTTWKLRGLAISGITFAILLFSLAPRWAMRLNNLLGAIKLFMMMFVIGTGFAALGGHLKIDNPHNFKDAFKGTKSDAYGISTALLNGIFSYGGYDNVNAVLSEVVDPVRTLKIIIPSAMSSTMVLYLLANIGYFAGVTKDQFTTSSVTVAASLFTNVFGDKAGTAALPALVALSALGHLVGIAKTIPVVIQELAKEDVLVFNNAFISTRPFGTPLGALALHWGVTVLFVCAPPAGEAFSFIVSLSSYPGNFISLLCCLGLLKIRYTERDWKANAPFRCPLIVIIVFILGSLFLLVAPVIPPHTKSGTLPYWLSPVVALGIIFLGIPYYLGRFILLPKLFGCHLEFTRKELADGSAITRYKWVKNE